MSSAKFHGLNTNNTLMIVTDFIMIFASFILAMFCAKLFVDDFFLSYSDIEIYIQFFTFAVPLHLFLLAVGLYNEKLRENFNGIAARIFVAVTISYFLTSLLSGFFPNTSAFFPYSFTELLSVIVFLTLCNCRFIVLKLGLNQLSKRRVLILGAGKRASIVEQCMRRKSDRIGLEFIGFVAVIGDAKNQVPHEKICAISVPLAVFVQEQHIHELVIAIDERRNNLPFGELLRLKQMGVKITDIIEFVERETGQVAVNYLTPSWFLFQNHRSKNQWRTGLYWLFNSLVALTIAIVTLPVMLMTILALKLEGGLRFPILYSQERVGLNGRNFLIYKFTSMRPDAEKEGAQWAQKDDPRTTKVGKFIRKFRIDELPQLYNVVIGDMYFVGPRPERPHFTKGFNNSIPFYNQRHNVKPGLTGWAQLKYPYGSSEKDALEKLKFDLYYIRNRNFILDLLILLKTSEIILFGKGR
ncbi:TIGR03013 family XrtA/PEP-CTERM system glycosyltransferase [Vibrio alfacsensis]|uniref:TIGR03013 family XrtA/PEP-CTERM system glycosyltransferase n=1 Tax=Vibrio alfacsensis TaxID=1074311 RepID=UPI0040682DED